MFVFNSEGIVAGSFYAVLAKRQPILLFRMLGAPLPRYEARQPMALVSHPPPRRTRAPSLAIAALSMTAGLALVRSAHSI